MGVIRNDDGVAGFFEDLPVLLFVLMGVTVLVLSAVWVNRENAEANLEETLNETARRIARSFLGSVLSEFGPIPRLSSIAGIDILPILVDEAQGHSFSVVVASVHPVMDKMWNCTVGDAYGARCTGFARLPFNATDDEGRVVILEARAVVW